MTEPLGLHKGEKKQRMFKHRHVAHFSDKAVVQRVQLTLEDGLIPFRFVTDKYMITNPIADVF